MDDVQNRLARKLAEAIKAAVAQSPEVEACHERAREAGFELKVTLDAAVGFATLAGQETASPEEAIAARASSSDQPATFEVSANDRRFLRSLRIAADEARVEEAN